MEATLTVPAGVKEVALAAVAGLGSATGDGQADGRVTKGLASDGLITMSKTATLRVASTITGGAATFSGQAKRVRPKRQHGKGRQTGKGGYPAGAQPGTRAGAGAGPVAGDAARNPAKDVAARSPVKDIAARSPAKEVAELSFPQVVPQQGAPAPARAPVVVPGHGQTPAPAVVPVPGQGAAPAAVPVPGQAAAPAQAVVPGHGQAAAPEQVVVPGGIVPSVSPQALSGAPAAGVQPSPASGPDEWGAAPLPWELAAPKRRIESAGAAGGLGGPKGVLLVVGGIGTLMGALWLIGTVQRGSKRRKVL
ncbi:hypothetical protein [Nonomuraea sp. NPDC002799]